MNDTIDTDSSDVDLSSKDSDFWLCRNPTHKIMQIHIDDKMRADFQVTIHNRKISILWDTGASKSVISEKCLQKIHYTDKVHPFSGIRCSSTSGSNISLIGILTLNIGLSAQKSKLTFIVCRNLRRPLILGLNFHHKFHIGTCWDSDGKLFLHKDGKTHYLHQNTKVPCQNIHNRLSRNSSTH